MCRTIVGVSLQSLSDGWKGKTFIPPCLVNLRKESEQVDFSRFIPMGRSFLS